MFTFWGIIIFVLVFAFLSGKINSLGFRVSKLEKELSKKKEIAQADTLPVNPVTGAPIWAPPAPLAPQESKEYISENDPVMSFVNWFKEDWLLKLGAFMIFIGFSWFVYYAFSNNWIGPMGRIAFGIIVGALVMVFGWWRMQKYTKQGAVFLWLGSAVVIMTIYSAREVYDFFTPISAMFLMFITTFFVVLASLQYKLKNLALVSLIMSGIIPLITSVGDTLPLFSYLAIILAGTVWVVSLTGWRFLNLFGFIIYLSYSFQYLFSHGSDSNLVLLFIYGFSLLLFITSLLSVLRKDIDDQNRQYDIATSVFSSLYLLLNIVVLANKDYSSLIIALWMIIYSFGSYFVFRISGRRESFFIHACISIAYLGAATAVELTGSSLIYALIIEATLIPVAIYIISKDIVLVKRFSFLIAVPAFLSLGYFLSYEWRDGFYPDGFTVIFFVSLGLFILSYLNNYCAKKTGINNPLVALGAITGSIFIFVLVWLTSHAGLSKSYGSALTSAYGSATLFSLVFYTVVGLGAFVYGKFRESKVSRVYGMTLVTLVVLRLLLIDSVTMSNGTRVVTAFAIGLILISSAFINKKKKQLN